jgi:2-dehydropantoate 2-reductase
VASIPKESIAIAGAGSIGCFVGGVLAAAGRDVAMLARPATIAAIESGGLRVTSFEGFDRHIAANRLRLSDQGAVMAGARIVLVTVKNADTAAMADVIARNAPPDAIVVSLQNGIGNAAVLRERLAGRHVLGAMVPFNVVMQGTSHVHRATSGDIVVEQNDARIAEQLSVAGLVMRPTDNITGVLWGKLLLNLNNAFNALSGLPLRDELSRRDWRRLLARQISEALAVMRAEGIVPVSSTLIPPAWTPYLLRLPDDLFRILAGRTIRIDPQARSSMWDDLQRGRTTEIDYLQGEILRLAMRHGIDVPLTRRAIALVKDAELQKRGAPCLAPAQIWPDRMGMPR